MPLDRFYRHKGNSLSIESVFLAGPYISFSTPSNDGLYPTGRKMEMNAGQRDDYYRLVESWDVKFWDRLGGNPPLEGLTCLDLGCGVGSLSIDLARKNATSVVGIDLDADRIDYAKSQRDELEPQLRDRTSFEARDLSSMVGENSFDIIVSRDCFEHIHELGAVIMQLEAVLKPGGRVFLGFGPLYNSPLGDHKLIGFGIPWLHLFLDKLGLAPRFFPAKYKLLEKELNRLSFEDMHALLENSALNLTFFEVNAGQSLQLKICRRLRRIKCIEEYFSVNIYAILTKASNA